MPVFVPAFVPVLIHFGIFSGKLLYINHCMIGEEKRLHLTKKPQHESVEVYISQ